MKICFTLFPFFFAPVADIFIPLEDHSSSLFFYILYYAIIFRNHFFMRELKSIIFQDSRELIEKNTEPYTKRIKRKSRRASHKMKIPDRAE